MAIRMTRAGVALMVGIIIVAGLIIGGLFYVKELGEQARREEAIQVAEQNLEAQADEEIALNEAEGSDESEANDGSVTNDGVVPGATEGTSSEGAPATNSDELPQTGPSDGIIFILAGIVTYLGVYVYQARRG